jgi:hypothetical protein
LNDPGAEPQFDTIVEAHAAHQRQVDIGHRVSGGVRAEQLCRLYRPARVWPVRRGLHGHRAAVESAAGHASVAAALR